MDSYSSSRDYVPKKDCTFSSFTEDSNLETLEINAISEKDSASKSLTIADNLEIKNIKTSTVSHEQVSHAIVDKKKADDSKSKIMNQSGLNFLPGSKLEAKDFNEKWYSAKVVETDWTEREVLIHFDKWSTRYDEWIPMDSSRLRELQPNTKEIKLKEFSIGEKILATWVDGKKYPATVKALLGNNKYDILFDDGYSKILKPSKMTKLVEVPTNKCKEKTLHVNNKKEKKDKKRKHKGTELLSSNSKKKIKKDNEKIQNQDLSDVHLRIEIEDSTYKCPKKGCNKNFRKENLLQMHIKHYHPEYSKYLGSTPNVADLAYARTIGESIEDLIPKKSRNAISYQVTSVAPSNFNLEFCSVQVDNTLANKFFDENVNNTLEDNLFLESESNTRSMSPDRLFDIRFKEEKAHTGIKTLLPVRSLVQKSDVTEQVQGTNNDNDSNKKQYSNDLLYKKQKPTSRDDNYDEVENISVNTSSIVHNRCNDTVDTKLDLDNVEHNQSKCDLSITNNELIKIEKLRREEIINCTCGYFEEDGLMIQCDLCLCWQHSYCNYIEKEEDVPEKYQCYYCQHSFRQRTSKKYFLDQNWIHEGQLPSLSNYNSNTKINENAAILKRSYDLLAGLLQIKDLLYSLRVKVNIAHSKDHPKLYLWAKSWNKIVIPNFKTEPVPVMEITKYENGIGEYNETLVKEKNDELCFSSTSDNNTQKLITSDTELMKILEEDSLQIEESELQTKYSASNIFKDEGRILLDALIKNEFDEQKNYASDQNKVTHQETLNQKCTTQSLDTDQNGKPQTFLSESGNKSLNLLQPIVPEPEEAIDPVECKLRLMEHIDHLQTYVDRTLDFIEVQLSALENLKDMKKQNINSHIQTKQTISMLINDLNLIRKLVDLF